MTLELASFDTVQEGLKELIDEAPSMSQNLSARVETPILEDGTDLWDDFQDSKIMQLYGSKNEDDRYRFKIDHNFDLSRIVDADINSDGSISIDKNIYTQSQARGFIIIKPNELEGTYSYYAIRANKYGDIREELEQAKKQDRKYGLDDLKKAGGFKINEDLELDELVKLSGNRDILSLSKDQIASFTRNDIEYINDGWLEHTVEKNSATEDEYMEGAKLFIKYIQKANREGCFRDTGKGMQFSVNTKEDDYKLRPWCVSDSGGGSSALGRLGFSYDGRFLRVAAQKIDYSSLASTLESSELDPELLGNELNPKSLQNMALAQAAYVAKQQK